MFYTTPQAYAISPGAFLPTPQGYSNYGMPVGAQQTQNAVPNSAIFKDPFSTAMSGNQTGTLQPYINRMIQNASDALYGGLLNYQPTPMVAGNAGGTPINSNVPQFNIPSGLLNFNGFGNRSWMQGGNNG